MTDQHETVMYAGLNKENVGTRKELISQSNERSERGEICDIVCRIKFFINFK